MTLQRAAKLQDDGAVRAGIEEQTDLAAVVVSRWHDDVLDIELLVDPCEPRLGIQDEVVARAPLRVHAESRVPVLQSSVSPEDEVTQDKAVDLAQTQDPRSWRDPGESVGASDVLTCDEPHVRRGLRVDVEVLHFDAEDVRLVVDAQPVGVALPPLTGDSRAGNEPLEIERAGGPP